MREHASLRVCVLVAALLSGRAIELPRATPRGVLGDTAGERPRPHLGSDALAGKKVARSRGDKVTLSESLYPNARCIDGSQGAYYINHATSLAGATKYYIFRQGGGFCRDKDGCYQRSKGKLGSSKAEFWKTHLNLLDEGVGHKNMGFSRDPTENPLMHDWNHIFVIYCDGGYFAGGRKSPYEVVKETVNGTTTQTVDKPLYASGSWIMNGVILDLMNFRGMTFASDIVFAGCSAGGISTITTINWLRDEVERAMPLRAAAASLPLPLISMPKIMPKIAGFVCSGFFLDYDYKRGEGGGQVSAEYREEKKHPYHLFEAHSQVNQGCAEEYGGEHDPEIHRCMIAQTSAHFAEVPLFLWESLYDDYMLANVLEEKHCKDAECAEPHAKNMRTALYNLWHLKPDFGGFLSGCAHHCEGSSDGDIGNIRPIDGKKPLQAFDQWYRTIAEPVEKARRFQRKNQTNQTKLQRYWTEEASYPCPECCPRAANPEATFYRVDSSLE